MFLVYKDLKKQTTPYPSTKKEPVKQLPFHHEKIKKIRWVK
jgi:hypothetical protein